MSSNRSPIEGVEGSWRLYFNRHGAADMPWCVAPDAGGWEIAVRTVMLHVGSIARYEPKATPDHEDGKPSAWIGCSGWLTVSADGSAYIGRGP